MLVFGGCIYHTNTTTNPRTCLLHPRKLHVPWRGTILKGKDCLPTIIFEGIRYLNGVITPIDGLFSWLTGVISPTYRGISPHLYLVTGPIFQKKRIVNNPCYYLPTVTGFWQPPNYYKAPQNCLLSSQKNISSSTTCPDSTPTWEDHPRTDVSS